MVFPFRRCLDSCPLCLADVFMRPLTEVTILHFRDGQSSSFLVSFVSLHFKYCCTLSLWYTEIMGANKGASVQIFLYIFQKMPNYDCLELFLPQH